ncbi:hypothetical protein AQUCO_11200028v1 [Aquilegia coerulea]|uniref:Uncharacterized protein n=1 Tax=Aquilegia coerulea TaxID=218851 RepID=A0A2G5C3V2_AQUCA|nr:hypothetical protein AQUCO_11200016v1 [Aquilegia coerulea]PIA25521.1 hypothetical protein AQUCO_11200028v1 [Aquilegia coerulea]
MTKFKNLEHFRLFGVASSIFIVIVMTWCVILQLLVAFFFVMLLLSYVSMRQYDVIQTQRHRSLFPLSSVNNIHTQYATI